MESPFGNRRGFKAIPVKTNIYKKFCEEISEKKEKAYAAEAKASKISTIT